MGNCGRNRISNICTFHSQVFLKKFSFSSLVTRHQKVKFLSYRQRKAPCQLAANAQDFWACHTTLDNLVTHGNHWQTFPLCLFLLSQNSTVTALRSNQLSGKHFYSFLFDCSCLIIVGQRSSLQEVRGHRSATKNV